MVPKQNKTKQKEEKREKEGNLEILEVFIVYFGVMVR
jgi:hypothetical protein